MIAQRAHQSPAEAAALAAPSAPIVLLAPRHPSVFDAIAPGLARHGWMLPYTPLHHLLLAAFGGPLVLTSGNLSGAPQAIHNLDATKTLGTIADAFLLHDRDIERRLDDSVLRITQYGPIVLRRARGIAPSTVPLPPGFGHAPAVAAYGGQMKAAICLLKNGRALLSHHLGDLDDAQTWAEFERADRDYAALFDHHPALAACDLNADYRAARFAAGRGLPLVEVQHHHAYLAAVLGDNLWPLEAAEGGGMVAGIVLDGLGLGRDGTFWGGEVVLGDYRTCARAAGLIPAPLIGGDRAAAEPWRNLLARLDSAGLGALMNTLFPNLPVDLVRQAAKAGINAPMSSSMGRLFDAFAAAVGAAPEKQSFEGEAAMRLEALASQWQGKAAPYPMTLGTQIDPAPLFLAWADDRLAGLAPAHMAARFHAGVAQAFAISARQLVQSGAAKAVALTGGCFQNAYLLEVTLRALDGVPVMIHRTVPPNDGGLAFGQALVAAAQNL